MSRPLLTRRDLLLHAGGGFGAVALRAMLAEQVAAGARAVDPLAPRPVHFPAKADRVIFIYSTGGVSHVDTFDNKPKLTADHGKTITASRWLGKQTQVKRFLTRSRFGFKQYGKNGTWISDLFPHLGGVID